MNDKYYEHDTPAAEWASESLLLQKPTSPATSESMKKYPKSAWNA